MDWSFHIDEQSTLVWTRAISLIQITSKLTHSLIKVGDKGEALFGMSQASIVYYYDFVDAV